MKHTFAPSTVRVLQSSGWTVHAAYAEQRRFGCTARITASGAWHVHTPEGDALGAEDHPALAAMECNNRTFAFRFLEAN